MLMISIYEKYIRGYRERKRQGKIREERLRLRHLKNTERKKLLKEWENNTRVVA